MTQFSTKIVYTVSEEVLFIPVDGIGTRQAIAAGDKFLFVSANSRIGCAFRMVDDPARRRFYVKPKYFDKIVEAK